MGGLIAGTVAALVGGGLAIATAVGVVNVVNEPAEQPEASVVDYGTNG